MLPWLLSLHLRLCGLLLYSAVSLRVLWWQWIFLDKLEE